MEDGPVNRVRPFPLNPLSPLAEPYTTKSSVPPENGSASLSKPTAPFDRNKKKKKKSSALTVKVPAASFGLKSSRAAGHGHDALYRLTSRGQPHVHVAVIAVLGRRPGPGTAAGSSSPDVLHAPAELRAVQPVDQFLALGRAGPRARAYRRGRAVAETRPVLASSASSAATAAAATALRVVADARAQGRTASAPRSSVPGRREATTGVVVNGSVGDDENKKLVGRYG